MIHKTTNHKLETINNGNSDLKIALIRLGNDNAKIFLNPVQINKYRILYDSGLKIIVSPSGGGGPVGG